MSDLTDAIGDRRLAELYRYWDGCRRGRAMPARGDIDPVDIPRLLPIVLLVEIEGEGKLRYRLVGTELVTVARRDVTGRRFEDVFSPGAYRDYVFALYAELIRQRQPIYTEGIYAIAGSGRRRFTRRLMLPMSADDSRVDMVLGGQVYEMVTDPERVTLHDGSDPFVETIRRTLPPGG